MKIDEMPAGEMIDDWIAEIMGFTRVEWGAVFVWETVGRAITEWRPSVNIAHAWEVVEKLKLMVFPIEKGWAACCAGEYGDPCIAHGDRWIDGRIDHLAYAPTAPLAICRSAILLNLKADRAT